MQYEKDMELQLVRTKHKIIIALGGTAQSLKECLKKVPDNAKMVNWEDRENDEVLIFEEEHIVKPYSISEVIT